jgi:predicted ArsR family transcriptional regulator
MGGRPDPVEGIAALAEPLRRRLYDFVRTQPEPVSRDEAATTLGLPRHTVKFHLDRMAADGLLEAGYARTSGRTGPGAGRPAKLYRRASREFSISLPERSYALAGELMAAAIDDSRLTGQPVADRLCELAHDHGRALGRTAPAEGDGFHRATVVLDRQGYEPRSDGVRATLHNCPFHALTDRHAELVCSMNLKLVGGLVEGLGDRCVTARLDPGPDRCCVVLEHAQA